MQLRIGPMTHELTAVVPHAAVQFDAKRTLVCGVLRIYQVYFLLFLQYVLFIYTQQYISIYIDPEKPLTGELQAATTVYHLRVCRRAETVTPLQE